MNTPSSTGATPLGQLLSETFSYCKAHWQSLAVGAVIFGIATGLVSGFVGTHAQKSVMQGMGHMGIDAERMQELTERMEQGDESAMAELEQMLAGEFDGMTEEQMAQKVMGSAAGMFAKTLPAIGFGIVVSWLLSLLAFAYFSLVAIEGKDVQGTVQRMKTVFFPLFALNLWVMIRTFVWIPVIGIIPAIILGPRFIAAPLIHLVEGKGIMASASESFARTRGYWAKIMGNAIVFGVIMIIAMIILLVPLSMVFSPMSVVGMVIQQILSQAAMACMTVFAIRLSHTILQHPRS